MVQGADKLLHRRMKGYSRPPSFLKLAPRRGCLAIHQDIESFSLTTPDRFNRDPFDNDFGSRGDSGGGAKGYGGENDQIRLMHHDARWRQEFEQTRSSILQSCKGRVVAVEHVGSTAIGGLIARPIIDGIAVVADPVDLADSSMLIEGLNFRAIEIPEWAQPLVPMSGAADPQLLEKPRHGETTHRIYVVNQGTRLVQETVRLREFLRSHPEFAFEFEERKVETWKSCDGHVSRYHEGMAVVFEEFGRRAGGTAPLS